MSDLSTPGRELLPYWVGVLDSNHQEPSGDHAYARQQVERRMCRLWSTSREISLEISAWLPESTGVWGVIAYWALFSASGDIVRVSPLTVPVFITPLCRVCLQATFTIDRGHPDAVAIERLVLSSPL